jgi:hypothetical protein
MKLSVRNFFLSTHETIDKIFICCLLVDLTVLSQVLACNVIMDNEGDGRGKKQ